ncbi:hypothetical protein DER45DRAFT_568663 [Fusarium avenaceum]|nr:hypothetical protein DER45DRAFT_568663 [Fusarium avenaceum]
MMPRVTCPWGYFWVWFFWTPPFHKVLSPQLGRYVEVDVWSWLVLVLVGACPGSPFHLHLQLQI